jgi:peptidoglycan/xylan/chitin deacetylase (PgdA/CDA1 family)
MIHIFSDFRDRDLNEIIRSAFDRSCGIGSSSLSSFENFTEYAKLSKRRWDTKTYLFDVLVLINPSKEISSALINILENSYAKVMIFGKLPDSIAKFLGIKIESISEQMKASALSGPAKTYQYAESSGAIVYQKALEPNTKKQTPLPSRALCRFDFTNEWNNLGFGAITADNSIWAISQKAIIQTENCIAQLVSGEAELSAYCGLWDYPTASLLWFNRAVGPVDSYEWCLVEQFIAQYRFGEIPAWPVISEIPYGFDSAITMRLDCDEDIESARALGNAYQENNTPFSLALHATVLSNPDQYQYPKDVLQSGGSILSHTLTHAPNWGGSKEASRHEGEESARVIEETIGVRPRYAVSPFHHTPEYARQGLTDAGYHGVVGGIISNDPDFVMARAGRPPYSSEDFIGHTQQCMLHGDCLLVEGDQLAIYKRAYDQARLSNTFFGYLDHPFSPRYQYGWNTETQRIAAHVNFINYIKETGDKTIFLNQDDALDFLSMKSLVRAEEFEGRLHVRYSDKKNQRSELELELSLKIAIQYGENFYQLTSRGLTL